MENPNLKQYKYTVGILIYHRTQALVDMAIECLDSVLRNIDRNETEIIIVDNGSPVRSEAWEKNADTYIRFNQNMGISHGWNALLKHAKGKYIAILGDDTKVRSGWLEGLQEAMDQPQCGVANIHVEHLPVGIGIVENYKWFSHACFMLTQETVKKVGYYREDLYYPCNFEDHDYLTRIYKAGLKAYVNYGKSIQHLEGQTVHAPDLSEHFDRLKKVFIEQHGFDNQAVFCGNDRIENYLQTTSKPQ